MARARPIASALMGLVGCAAITADAAAPRAPLGDEILFEDGFENVVPRLWYRFEGDGSNTGALPGYALSLTDSSFGTGKVGQAVTFGAGGFANVAGMRSVLGTYAQVTVAFWSNVPAPLSFQALWSDINQSVAPYGGVQLGWNGSAISVCVATTTSAFLSGSCNGFTAPSTGAWHHWIIRYAGTGTGPGQGGSTEIYVDDVLRLTRFNDVSNNPVFTETGIADLMSIGGSNASMDELKIYNRVFSQEDQCTFIIGGTWTGSSCTLP